LEQGFNPYKDNSTLAEFIESLLLKDSEKNKTTKPIIEQPIIEKKIAPTLPVNTIKKAVDLALQIKSKTQSEHSHGNFKSIINRFLEWLKTENINLKDDIAIINKKLVIQYLNSVLQATSPRNRNNTRTDISSLFQTLENNEIIQDNFIKKINVLKAIPERNKTYTPTEEKEIFSYLKQNDAVLFLFVQFISYYYLRPVEVCRLKIGDLDLKDKKLYVKAKNKLVKIKIIPHILIEQLPDISNLNKEDYLFKPDKIGGKWDTKENNKREYFTKQFKKVKDHFGLNKNYGLYSFRHTFITKLYKEMAKTATPLEVKNKLQLIIGHSTMEALNLYLRDIDAVLPEDYSKLIK
jgi:integrase